MSPITADKIDFNETPSRLEKDRGRVDPLCSTLHKFRGGGEEKESPITVNKTRSSYEEFRGAMDSFSTDVEKFNARVGIDVLRAQNVVSEIVSNGVKYDINWDETR